VKSVGAAARCDLLMLILKIRSKDRSLVALDSSYTGIAEYPNNCGLARESGGSVKE
jgi:hypothetical protein